MFTLKFTTENAAFQGDDIFEEVPRILQRAASDFASGDVRGDLYDSNGNRVGEWECES